MRVVGRRSTRKARRGARKVSSDGVEFRVGGFELNGLHPILVRAFNVLRQYPEEAVASAWQTMQARLAPGGLILDGTCDELGRLGCWVLLDRDGPVGLTLACDARFIERPSDLAERFAESPYHHNIPGQPIHHAARRGGPVVGRRCGQSVFGPRARWRAMRGR